MSRTGLASSTATGPASSGGTSGRPGTDSGTSASLGLPLLHRRALSWLFTSSWQVATLREDPGGRHGAARGVKSRSGDGRWCGLGHSPESPARRSVDGSTRSRREEPPVSRPVLQVIAASTRPGRRGLAVAHWLTRLAAEHGGFDVELVDLAEVGLPVFDEPNHPRLQQYEHQHTKDWSATVSRADAFVFVTPEYNHSFPGALKNALDFLSAEWADKAAGLISYGGVSAGLRASSALKPVLAALRMLPVVEAVSIPFFAQFLDGD